MPRNVVGRANAPCTVQMYQDGVRQLNLRLVVLDLVVPVVVVLGLALAVPYLLATSLVPAFGQLDSPDVLLSKTHCLSYCGRECNFSPQWWVAHFSVVMRPVQLPFLILKQKALYSIHLLYIMVSFKYSRHWLGTKVKYIEKYES